MDLDDGTRGHTVRVRYYFGGPASTHLPNRPIGAQLFVLTSHVLATANWVHMRETGDAPGECDWCRDKRPCGPRHTGVVLVEFGRVTTTHRVCRPWSVRLVRFGNRNPLGEHGTAFGLAGLSALST